MADTYDFFDTMPPMRGFRGDTFPIISVYVKWNYSLAGTTMKVVLEPRYTPGTVALEKDCGRFTQQDKTGFNVQLTSDDTANLLGTYNMFFVMTDSDGNKYKRLHGIIEVLDFPEVT